MKQVHKAAHQRRCEATSRSELPKWPHAQKTSCAFHRTGAVIMLVVKPAARSDLMALQELEEVEDARDCLRSKVTNF